MKVLAVALLIVLVAGLVSTVAAQDDESGVAHVRVRRANPCPPNTLNNEACRRHCRSSGHSGGRCTGSIKMRECKCD
uniref:Putative tick defensins 1 n=1 Tax=Amblyomma cajennense TaxID=34607 RepID=A0A023FSN2_AMBCJ